MRSHTKKHKKKENAITTPEKENELTGSLIDQLIVSMERRGAPGQEAETAGVVKAGFSPPIVFPPVR